MIKQLNPRAMYGCFPQATVAEADSLEDLMQATSYDSISGAQHLDVVSQSILEHIAEQENRLRSLEVGAPPPPRTLFVSSTSPPRTPFVAP